MLKIAVDICLPKGRHSEAAHEKRLLCAQKCTRVGWGWGGWGRWDGSCRVGWGGVGGSCRGGVGGVGHVGVGWGVVSCRGGGGSCRGGVGHEGWGG